MLGEVIKLFEVSSKIIDEHNNKTNRLVFNSCKAIVYDKTYSELDELTFADLNHNNYDFGYIEYEFSFIENFRNPYMNFYISCFALRMNRLGYPIKLNTPRPEANGKLFSIDNYTKVNGEGNLSCGIRYFFKSEEERNAILESEELCIEGSISFGSKRNVYDIMCRIVKTQDGWELDEAYTYRTHAKAYIYSLVH